MPNLLDAINNNTSAVAGQKMGQTDQTQTLAGLLRAKSGKAVAAPEVGMSNLGEQSATAGANATMANQVAPAAAIQESGTQEQGAAIGQGVQEQQAQLGQAKQFNTLQNKLQTTALLNQFKQNEGGLKMQENEASVQQFAQGLRLQNAQYIDKLQMAGDKARLDDANSFKEEMAKTTFGDNTDVLTKQLGDKSILDANNNEFKTAMGNMSVDQANTILDNELASAKKQGLYTGLGNLATAGVGAYGAYEKNQDQTDTGEGT